MKQLWIAAAILALMVGLLAMNTHYLSDFLTPLSQSLSQASDAALEGNWETAQEKATLVRAEWEKHDRYLHMVQNHVEVDGISKLLTEAERCLADRRGKDYAAVSSTLTDALVHLDEMERLSAENLF